MSERFSPNEDQAKLLVDIREAMLEKYRAAREISEEGSPDSWQNNSDLVNKRRVLVEQALGIGIPYTEYVAIEVGLLQPDKRINFFMPTTTWEEFRLINLMISKKDLRCKQYF